jgi:hypothetical protein
LGVVNLSASSLLASMFWSAIATGFLVYAKRQRSIPAFLGGIGLLGVSYFTDSVLLMSVASIAIIAATVFFIRRDDAA